MELDLLGLLLLALAGGLLANLIELPIIHYFTRPKRLLLRLANPDEELFEAFEGVVLGLIHTADQPIMHTGEKDDKGREIMISPMAHFTAVGADAILSRIRGVQGSVEKGAQAVASQLGFGIPLPRKGQSTGEFLFEQIMTRAMPAINEKIEEALNKKGPNTIVGGINRYYKGD